MKEKLKLWYSKSKNQINMTKFIFISVILLVIVWIFDVRIPSWKAAIPEFLLLPTDVSKTFLSTLSGVFLTVTTFTFATVLTVLGNHASSLTPRVVQKFIDKPYVLSLLGIFIGGFFYSMLSLFFLHGVDAEKNMLAGTLAILYGLTSMGYLVYFMQKVLSDMRANKVIQDIYASALALVDEEAKKRKKSERFQTDKIVIEEKVYADKSGFLFGIDYDKLYQLLENLEGELVIVKKIGEFVYNGLYIANLHVADVKSLAEIGNETLLEDIADCFLYSEQKNDTYDYHNEITNLVEIALRAISPGINDPNTAIECIRKMSVLMGRLFSTENKFIVSKQSRKMRVVYTSYTIEEELYASFHQIIHYGKEDPSVAAAILEGLTLVNMISAESAYASIEAYFAEVYEVLIDGISFRHDKRHLQMLRSKFYRKQELGDEEATKTAAKSEEV